MKDPKEKECCRQCGPDIEVCRGECLCHHPKQSAEIMTVQLHNEILEQVAREVEGKFLPFGVEPPPYVDAEKCKSKEEAWIAGRNDTVNELAPLIRSHKLSNNTEV